MAAEATQRIRTLTDVGACLADAGLRGASVVCGLAEQACRPAIAASQLEAADDHNILIHLKNEWAGGLKSVLVSPRDLAIRALAQVPLPRRLSLCYHGCFTPNSHLLQLVVPAGAMAKAQRQKSCVEKDETTMLTWSLALRRDFGWDVLKCPCGGTCKVVAAVQDAPKGPTCCTAT